MYICVYKKRERRNIHNQASLFFNFNNLSNLPPPCLIQRLLILSSSIGHKKKKKSTLFNEMIVILDHRIFLTTGHGWKKSSLVQFISAVGKRRRGRRSRKNFTGDKAGLSGTWNSAGNLHSSSRRGKIWKQ